MSLVVLLARGGGGGTAAVDGTGAGAPCVNACGLKSGMRREKNLTPREWGGGQVARGGAREGLFFFWSLVACGTNRL